MQIIETYATARDAINEANARRAPGADARVLETVREICAAVKSEGDAAVLRYTQKLDCENIELSQLRVLPEEIEAAWNSLPKEAQGALERAAKNIEWFHRRQPVGNWTATSPDGVLLGQRQTPIERVALYAPHGKAAYPSSVLMLAIPAQVAGVPQIVLASPAGKNGEAHPVVLAAARVAGITEIYKLGGAVAVAALAYGTETISPVRKIVGPGNIFFTTAKQEVAGFVGVDGFYGPSEVVILADESTAARSSTLPSQIAADLLAQAEHGADSWVCLISNSRALIEATQRELESQFSDSPREKIARASLESALFLCVEGMDEACELANLAAAEHLEIWSEDATALSEKIADAGAIFLNTPVPLGDYIAGPSHTLPTGMTARFAGGVGVDTFLKRSSIVSAPPSAIQSLAEDLAIIAELEDLPGHAVAVRRCAAN